MKNTTTTTTMEPKNSAKMMTEAEMMKTMETNTATAEMPGTATGMMNGIDVEGIAGTIDAVKSAPSLAAFQFRASNRWIGGAHNRTVIQGFYGVGQEDTTRKEPFVLDNDEPQVMLGTDVGANPVEYVLHALAGCLTTSMVFHAAARGIRIEEIESRLEGDLDLHGFLGLSDAVRNGYENVRVHFRIKADVPDDQLETLIGFGTARSPVFDMVTTPVPVEVTVSRKD